MSGPVALYGSNPPFAATVIAGDSNVGAVNAGPGLTVAVVQARQSANDDLDDSTPEGHARARAYQQQQIAAGIFDKASIDKGNAATASKTDGQSDPNKPIVPADCAAIHNHYDLSTGLSSKTTLGDFIRTAPAISKYKYSAVPAQSGLRSDEIVCNLANLCTNVWEPIKAQYPNAIMTNNLRTGNDIGAGPHGTGQACDIQFNTSGGVSIPPRDYYDIALWVKQNIAFDQLILEYHTARGPLTAWLHVGIYAGTGKKTQPQNRLLTMMNGTVKYSSLAQLAT
jgi:hypothetical protein